MRRLSELVAWVFVVTGLIAFCGVMTAPLLLILTADLAVGVLLVRTLAEPARLADHRPAAS